MKNETFQMKKGQILLVKKQGNQYLILWGQNNQTQHWPHGDNKIILPAKNVLGVIRFLSVLSSMFGVNFKRREVHESSEYECIFEII